MSTYQQIQQRLEEAGQEHLLRFWDEISQPERGQLLEQIERVDLALVNQLFAEKGGAQDKEADWAELAARALPPPAVRLDDSGRPQDADAAEQTGLDFIREGKIGMILVAGGQGSRLGFDHPKGMFPLGPVSRRTLFQILLEPLAAIKRRYGASVPLYIMTSPATHEETIEFLDQHQRFGLPADQVRVFCQGVMPAVDLKSGKMLLSTKSSLFLAPDGHGGMLAALADSGCLADARSRSVEHFFYCQVDNPLVRVCDPVLVGHHVRAGSELTTMVVAKTDPLQRVGNVVSIDGKVRIIEYSDLPDEIARQQEGGALRLWAGNVAVHVFCADFLQRMALRPSHEGAALPFHRAEKPTSYVNEQGQEIRPEKPNAMKFERFIFDLLPSAQKALAVECNETESFAPVKNASGAESDTPETAQAAMSALHKKWLHSAGAQVNDEVTVEISPLFAMDPKELTEKVAGGLHIDENRFFV